MAELTMVEVREWLTENKENDEVKGFLREISPTQEIELNAETVKPWLDTVEGKALIQPTIDQRINSAVKSFREGNYEQDLKARVASELVKLNPTETPEQKQIRELREAFEGEKSARQKDKLKREIVEEASRMTVDAFFIDDYLPGSVDEGKLYLQKIKARDEARDTKIRNEILATEGFKPGSGKGTAPRADISKMTKAQILEAEIAGTLDDMLSGT